MKIALAGMKECPNQFSRGIENAGCQVVHLGTQGCPIPTFVEAVVIAKCQISHQLFWDAKEFGKKTGKPVFIADTSFAKISGQFSEYVKKAKSANATTVLGKALADAGAIQVPRVRLAAIPQRSYSPVVPEEVATASPPKPIPLPPKKVEELVKKSSHNFAHRYTDDHKAKIEKTVTDCLEAGLSAKETLEMLHAENLTKASGEPFEIGHVYEMRNRFKKLIATKTKKREKVPAPKTEEPIASPQPPAKAVYQSGDVALMNRILDLGIAADKTIEFLNAIRKGEINLKQANWMLDVIEDLKK